MCHQLYSDEIRQQHGRKYRLMLGLIRAEHKLVERHILIHQNQSVFPAVLTQHRASSGNKGLDCLWK